ncbi:transcriptional regulator FtsR [Flaviflexus equikiangi]|uniref:MerR family transcriptional regulator n=1 Tax=Flaviflexus equikiangi TaxID=2758573 RepID=A0ABS2TIG6_9ACTO|nr:MerR family transcriptional regulator [Flaviflexus equikiangi]MBM9434148.1 MerR family transcriptional regulator [Flaviflexus equikiangi]
MAQAQPLSHGEATAWPFDVSHDPVLKIGEVRDILGSEFPMLNHSKIRYYESIELVVPHRTPSNQRLFSHADVERLRFILTEQRDRYLPLTQIGELLRQLDAGEAGADHPGRMRAVVEDDVPRPKPGTRLSKREVSDLTGADLDQIEEFARLGVVEVDPRGRLTSHAVDIIRYALMVMDAGFDPRHVRAVKNSAGSHAASVRSTLAPQLAKQSPVARERAYAQGSEMSAILVKLYQALLVENVEIELDSSTSR